MLKVAFRTDASVEIGTGHVVRCRTLADIFKKLGVHVIFSTIGESAQVVSKLSEYPVISPDQLEEEGADFIVIDHYGLDDSYRKKCKEWAKKTVIIDDINVQSFTCDYLISQNPVFTANEYKEQTQANTKIFCGPEYLLLRPEFIIPPAKVRQRSVPPKKILLFFGGTDNPGLTTRVLNIFKTIQHKAELIVVSGIANRDNPAMESLSKELGDKHYINTNKMHELVEEADMGIACGGTAIWERLAMGLPTLELVHSDFQIPVLKQLDKAGYIHYLGDCRILDDTAIRTGIEKALEHGITITPCRCGHETESMAKQILAGI